MGLVARRTIVLPGGAAMTIAAGTFQAAAQDDRFRGWEVADGVDNIFNTQYKEYLHNEPAKGRTFKLSLSRQFGW